MTLVEYRARLKGRRCYAGLDLSSTADLTALVGVFPDDTGFDVLAEFFVPEESLRQRVLRDKVPYDQWARNGWLNVTPGAVVDYEAVRRRIHVWAELYALQIVAYDLWNATDLVTRLEQQDGFTCIQMRQGFSSLSAPSKSLEKAILSKQLRHDGHPVLRWNVQNVSVETDAAGNLKPSKKVSTERIDGVSALVMAIDVMDRNQSLAAPSFQMLVIGGR